MERKWLYVLERIDKHGFRERIIAWNKCSGWHCIERIPYNG